VDNIQLERHLRKVERQRQVEEDKESPAERNDRVKTEILEEMRAFFDAEQGTYALDNSHNKASSRAFNSLRDKRGFLSALESLVAEGV
jgi:hypothetical protein